MSDKKKRKPVRACLIVSERSGQDTFHLDEALTALTSQGWDVAVREKREKGDAVKLAKGAADDGYDPIVNCGGDGTFNEIVEALTGTDVAVGVIPGGTVNVWARQLGILERSRPAATQLASSRRVKVDVGVLEMEGEEPRRFIMMAGLGADGAVMQKTSRPLKERIGSLAVGVAAVQALPDIHAVPVTVELDGVRWEGPVTEIIVGNTRQYGGFTQATPDAYIDDGLLDVCLFTPAGILGAGRQLASMLIHRHPSDASSEKYRAETITVHAPSPLPLQIDGSSIDPPKDQKPLDYRFSVIPGGLTVLVPSTYDGALFRHGLDEKPRKGGKKRKTK